VALDRARHFATTVIVVALLVGALYAVGRRIQTDPRDHLAADGSGSIWFPRGGPYILGFESPGRATLSIDGVVIVEGEGLQSKRLVYERGVHSVKFEAPPEARLLWHPPGRRGALEYMLASSLSPDPPTQAEFTGPGTDYASAGVVIAIYIVLAWGLITIARAFDDGRIWGPGMLVFLIALAARTWGITDAGQTWDEDEYWSSGKNYVVNVLNGDLARGSWRWNAEHPPVTKYLAGAGALAQDDYDVARVLFAVLGAGACVLTLAAGRRLFGGRAGFVAGVIAALLPHLIAHGRIVGHETPSVFFWTLAVWLGLRAVQDDRERPVWMGFQLAGAGIALGLAAGVRFPNLLVAPVMAAAILAYAGRRWLRSAAIGLAVIPATAAATLYAIWPRLWGDPIGQLQGAYRILRQQHLPEPYLGDLVQRPPWHYFPVYFLVTTPLLVLVAAFVFGGLRAALQRERGWIVVAVWLLAPFGLAFSPVRQDGVRYVLPALVPLAIAAGAGIDAIMARASRVAFLLGLVVVGYLGYVCSRIQPFYLDYYNEVVGGPERVAEQRLFEIGWWGEGIGEAVAYVNRRAVRGAGVVRMVQPNHITWFRGSLWAKLADRPNPDTDWVVVNDLGVRTAGGRFEVPAGFHLAYEVKASGASLARVYKRDGARERGEAAPE
jgi:4-amino-4-deoxy-L-arabinose transferase-like glycosyltransferase